DISSTPARFAIPKAIEKDPRKLNKLFELLNYISIAEEGGNLVRYGVPGRHYHMKDGNIAITDLANAEIGHSWLYQFTGRPEMEYVKTKYPQWEQYLDFSASQPRIQVLNNFVDFPEGYSSAEAGRYIEEEIAKF